MKTAALKIIRLERYIIAGIMTIFIFAIAELSGQKEIIFPEVLAIITGAWIAEIQPWSINKRKMFLLISLSSIIGVAVVKYIPVHLFFQVCICFAFTGLSLILTRTNFIPIISACILPVYLQTTSWVYSIAVTTMALMIIFMQWIMEKRHLRPRNHYNKKDLDFKTEFKRWLKLLLVFGAISIIPISSRNIFLLAPPLIVAFTEFANPKSPLRKKALNIYFIFVLAALTGTVLKYVLTLYLHFPLTLSAIIACIILFAAFDHLHIFFPPAGAVLLLPMILRAEDLKFFPIEVAISAAILIPLAMFLFPVKKNKEKSTAGCF
jgi:hypothetical protein